MAGRKM